MVKQLLPLLLFLLAGTVHGQATQEDRDHLARIRQSLEGFADAQTEEQLAMRDALLERKRILEELISTSDALESLPTEDQLAARKTVIEQELAQLAGETTPGSLDLEDPDQLAPYEQAAIASEAARVQAQSILDDYLSNASSWESELGELPARAETVRQREAELTGEDELTKSRQQSAELERRVISERTTFLTAALGVRAAQLPVFELELQLATAKSTHAGNLFEIAATEATALREAAAELARREAEAEARRAERERDPIERFRLRIRSETSSLRAETAEHLTKLTALENKLEREKEAVAYMTSECDGLTERLRLQPQSDEVLLQRKLERTQRADRLLDDVTLPQLYVEMEQNQTRLAEVLDRRWELGLPVDENEILADLLDEVGSEREEEARLAFTTILREEELREELGKRESQLAAMDRKYGDLAEKFNERDVLLAEFEDFVLGKMMWSRSDAPITASTFVEAFRELGRIADPYRDSSTWATARSRIMDRLGFVLLMLGVVVGLDFARRRLRSWREESSPGQGWPGRIARVVGSLIWAALPALQIWLIAWTIRNVGGLHAFDPPLAILLEFQAAFILLRRLFIVFIGYQGLWVGEQGMEPEVGLQIVRSVRTVTLAGQILFAPYRVFSSPPFEFENFPRFLYTLWILSAGVACLSLLRGKGAIVRNWTPPGTISRGLARTLEYLGSFALLPVVGLDAFGYRIGAESSLLNGLRVLIAFFVLVGLFRFLEGLGDRFATWSVGRAKDEEEAARLNLRANAARVISRLSATLVVILAAVMLQQMWGIGDPGKKLFVGIELFMTKPATDTDPAVFVTLWDVYVAVMFIIIGHLVTHNLKRIHDLLIIPVAGAGDAGSRYAVLTLLRYALLFLTYMGALLHVGFSFEAIGLFATAASVGLGFGLQEIVANFISGLILLFERPIRVGDIVTIGNISGTVNEIAMRATIVTNWERQTLIIPNKKFVTENLTNWTSTDRIMRRDLDIRVAYGSNVEEVLRLFDQIVGSLVPEVRVVRDGVQDPVLHAHRGRAQDAFRFARHDQRTPGGRGNRDPGREVRRVDGDGLAVCGFLKTSTAPGFRGCRQGPKPAAARLTRMSFPRKDRATWSVWDDTPYRP